MREHAVYSAGVLEKVLEEGRWEAGPGRDCARSVVTRVSADGLPLQRREAFALCPSGDPEEGGPLDLAGLSRGLAG